MKKDFNKKMIIILSIIFFVLMILTFMYSPPSASDIKSGISTEQTPHEFAVYRSLLISLSTIGIFILMFLMESVIEKSEIEIEELTEKDLKELYDAEHYEDDYGEQV